jgi:photosystem II stability/assembly factor-like uncharacterized protein
MVIAGKTANSDNFPIEKCGPNHVNCFWLRGQWMRLCKEVRMDASAVIRFRSAVPLVFAAALLFPVARPVNGAGAMPTTVYAGGSSLFKSTDAGLTWTDIGTGIGRRISAVAVDPTDPAIIYAGTFGGMLKTVDGGAHWTPIANGMSFVDPWNGTSSVSTIVIDPTNARTLYAGTGGFGTGVFKSTNGGTNWYAIDNGLTTGGSLDVRAMVIDPLNPNTLYVTGVTGISTAKTIDGGARWTPFSVPSGLRSGFATAIDPTQTATVYIAGPSGISKSTDAGVNWSEINKGISDTFVVCLTVDPSAPATLFAGTGNTWGGLFKSVDGGANWAVVPEMPPFVYTVAVDPANSRMIYAASNNGVFRSTDGGATWQLSLAGWGFGTLVMAPEPPVSVQTRLENLAGAVSSLATSGGPLNFGQANALLQKLGGAFQPANGKNPRLACNHLGGFLNQVADLVKSGVLTVAQGAPLTTQAQDIMQAIPCS